MQSNRFTSHKFLRILSIPLIFVLALLLINYGIVKAPAVVRAHAEGKLLPIYCVDRSADNSAPKVSLSFDAAWGND